MRGHFSETKAKIFAAFAILALVASACSPAVGDAAGASEPPRVGALAPDFTVSTLDGNAITLSQLRGKPVVINFFASWCAPCRLEAPHLQEAYARKSKDGLVIIGINMGEGKPQAEQFVKDYGWSFDVVLDPGQKVTQKYQLIGLPATFFVGRDGVLKSIKVGAFISVEELMSAIDKVTKA